MVNVPLVPVHPVPPVRVQVPVIDPPLRVVPVSVPVTVPVSVSVFPEDSTTKVKVPFTCWLELFKVKSMVPVGVIPVAGKQSPSVRN